MINARAETLEERPAYREAFRRFRCLVIADGFYEWRRREGASSQPFHITRPDGRPFAFAGLWSVWRAGAESVRSCTIVTTQATGAVASLHDRMPVILPDEAEAEWLAANVGRERLRELVSQSAAQDAELRAVNPVVNDARHDAPDCLDEPEAMQPSLF
jgi:putative SOS response-associated peptidase YedK